MNIENLKYHQEEAIFTITIYREKHLNALNKKTILELNDLLCRCENNPSIRVVVLTGSGKKAFVAGADIKEFSNYTRKQGQELAQFGHDLLFNKIANYSKPVIAAVNGFALGGGLELAMASHIRVASENARLGQPEVGLGVIPGYGGTQRLTQLVGKGRAFEMILTGEMITANQALDYGLVNYVVSQKDLIPKATELAHKMIGNSPRALKKSIKAINAVFDDIGFQNEVELFGQCFGTEEFNEGVSSFLEKRKPNYKRF